MTGWEDFDLEAYILRRAESALAAGLPAGMPLLMAAPPGDDKELYRRAFAKWIDDLSAKGAQTIFNEALTVGVRKPEQVGDSGLYRIALATSAELASETSRRLDESIKTTTARSRTKRI